MMLTQIREQASQGMAELIQAAKPLEGEVVVVGCSSSEVAGERIGSNSSVQIAQAILEGIYPHILEHKLFLAAQCCEHLNRAIIVEQEGAVRFGLEIVNAVPKPKAGGAFASACWEKMERPVAVEEIRAACGMDIGGTLIGMHLKRVAVPVRLSVCRIGQANVLFARTRPKYIGGSRTSYRSQ